MRYHEVSTERKIFTRTGVMADVLDRLVAGNSSTNIGVFNTTESLINITQVWTPSREEESARILNLVIRPFLILFGTIVNGLSFYIMLSCRKKRMQNSSISMVSVNPSSCNTHLE